MALKHKSLSTRDKARELARDAQRSSGQIIDLAGVEFVSRSFADELVKQAKKHNLDIVGASKNVKKMLEIVSQS